MNKKVLFVLDKDLDFRNHLVVAEFLKGADWISDEAAKYFKSLRGADEEQKRQFFEKYSKDFYNKTDNSTALQIQEKWDTIEYACISRMEMIHKNKFPFETLYGVLSTTPFGYGYDFLAKKPWFACPEDNPLEAIDVTTHEIMHAFFDAYFAMKYQNKFELSDQKVFMIREALTVILNLEFNNLRTHVDLGYPGHVKLRDTIRGAWIEYKDLDKTIDLACLTLQKIE